MKRTPRLLVALLVLFLTTCGVFLVVKSQALESFVGSGQLHREEGQRVTLDLGHQVGQTFVAHHAGLKGVEVCLAPTAEAQGPIVLHLRERPTSVTDILTTTIFLPAGSEEGFYLFAFPPILSSHTEYYYAVLEHQGSGQIEIPGAKLGAYLDGTLHYDHESQESQAVFRLIYDPASIVLDLLLMVAAWVGYGMAAMAILFFSGYWIVRKWARNVGLDFTATLISSAVAALAAWMVFLTWASLVLVLGTTTVRLIVFACTLLGLVQFAKDREHWRKKEYWLGDSPFSTMGLWLVVILSIALRLFVGRGMVMLPGADTYHHTLIVRLFEEQGGIPHSYLPYTPLISFSYHFGFHSIVALFRWLFGTELLITTKTVALVLNGAIAVTVALVTERWAGNRRAGVIAAAIVGLVAVSPFGLLRWGRFTQTTGLLFLAAGLLALTAVREGAGWALPSQLIAALAISHFRVVLLLVLFAVIAGAVRILQGRWQEVRDWLVVGVASIVLVTPWLLRVAWVQYDPYGMRAVSPVLEGAMHVRRLEASVLSFVTNVPLLILTVLSAWVVWFGKGAGSKGRFLVIWLLVAAGGGLLFSALGVTFFLDVVTTLTSVAVGVGILMGLAAEYVWRTSRGQASSLARAGIVVVLVLGMAAGLLYFPRLMREGTTLYLRPGDLVAMEWLENSLPEDALVLVNGLDVVWSPGWILGTDAGYWLPLLAHRETTVPPMIYPLEWGDPLELTARLEASRAFLSRNQDGGLSLEQTLDRYGITHVFVDVQDRRSVLLELAQEQRLKEIYRQDLVWVFEVVR